jgi:hypothetical protein
VESEGRDFGRHSSSGQFDKDAAHLLNFLIFAEKMLVTQEITKTELSSLGFGFAPRKKRAVFRPQLLGGVTRHPKDLSVSHPASGNAMTARGCFEPVLRPDVYHCNPQAAANYL